MRTNNMLDSWVNPNLVVKFKLTVDIIDVVLSQGDCLQPDDIRIVGIMATNILCGMIVML